MTCAELTEAIEHAQSSAFAETYPIGGERTFCRSG
jgi:hypothetical protein